LLVKRQDHAGAPDRDVSMQCAQLAIGVLTGILLLQLHEYRLDRPLGLYLEPAADLIPDYLERILARAIRAWPERLLGASILAMRSRWCGSSPISRPSIVSDGAINTEPASRGLEGNVDQFRAWMCMRNLGSVCAVHGVAPQRILQGLELAQQADRV
jgi:hypothetical protein